MLRTACEQQEECQSESIKFHGGTRGFFGIVSLQPLQVLAAERAFYLHFSGDTQCLPLYRYAPDGQRISNITEWGLRQFRKHYEDGGITAEDIFAYTYAVLDAAVAASYGWPANLPDAEILQRLLALNLQRSESELSA